MASKASKSPSRKFFIIKGRVQEIRFNGVSVHITGFVTFLMTLRKLMGNKFEVILTVHRR